MFLLFVWDWNARTDEPPYCMPSGFHSLRGSQFHGVSRFSGNLPQTDPKMKLLLKVTSVVLCLLLFNTCEILSKPLEKRLTLVNQIIDLINVSGKLTMHLYWDSEDMFSNSIHLYSNLIYMFI